MGADSRIEWTDHTFNPWTGCQKVSPACDHCYAEGWAKRSGLVSWGPHASRRRTSPANWRQPLKWDREAAEAGVRKRVFCASLADVFDNHGSITSGWHGDLWALIHRTPNLDWLLLTKRPQNIAKMLPESYGMPEWGEGWPNVWLGTTVENQQEADRRILHLLTVPAIIHFLSCEPLLGPVDLGLGEWVSLFSGRFDDPPTPQIDWVIAGGESGPERRPSDPDWFRSLRDQCGTAGVAFLFKQWGGLRPKDGGRLLDGREWNEVPDAR